MLQGTGSDVGKSLLVAGLARALTRRGLKVRPFKPQNMSNNAAVTIEGGEIGRAQALQARACGVRPSTDMNPVLLKPQSERGAQVVVEGRVLAAVSARDYLSLKPRLLPRVVQSFERLAAAADIVLVEGAGSPAEVNLRADDIANMGFAAAADLPVLLVGDIERGGVIAALVGTCALLAPEERARIKGYVVNKFRGDPRLFDGALDVLKEQHGIVVSGRRAVFPAARDLPAEDGMMLDAWERASPPSPTLPLKAGGGNDVDGGEIAPPPLRGRVGSGVNAPRSIRIVVPRLPRIANFDDLDPLAAEPGVIVDLIPPGRPLPRADLILLPGSKATLADLATLRQEGWDIDIAGACAPGRPCAGALRRLSDVGPPCRRSRRPSKAQPGAVRRAGPPRCRDGARRREDSHRSSWRRACERPPRQRGYEMHLGRTEGPGAAQPMLRLEGREDGAVSADGRIAGCHLHGLFAADAFRRAFLARLGGTGDPALDYEARIEATLDALAAHLEASLDVNRLLEIAGAR